jgi:hypothetical protein
LEQLPQSPSPRPVARENLASEENRAPEVWSDPLVRRAPPAPPAKWGDRARRVRWDTMATKALRVHRVRKAEEAKKALVARPALKARKAFGARLVRRALKAEKVRRGWLV